MNQNNTTKAKHTFKENGKMICNTRKCGYYKFINHRAFNSHYCSLCETSLLSDSTLVKQAGKNDTVYCCNECSEEKEI